MIINLPADGTLPTDIVCAHNRNRFHDTPFHQHSHHIELIVFISGNAFFYTKNQAFPIKPGYLIAIPNGVWHRVVSNDFSPYERIFLNVDLNLIKRLSTSQTDLFNCFKTSGRKEVNILGLNQNDLSQYISLCDQLIPTLDQDAFGDDVNQKILLSQILLMANKAHKVQIQPKNIIPKFLEEMTHYIDENLDQDLSLTAFSKNFYLSSNYLNKHFKKYLGISIHQYVTEKRIEQAKQLLRANLSVTEVCQKCGFGNYSNFIRSFSNHVGMAPGKYKRKYNETGR